VEACSEAKPELGTQGVSLEFDLQPEIETHKHKQLLVTNPIGINISIYYNKIN